MDNKRDRYSELANQFDTITYLYDRRRRIETLFNFFPSLEWEKKLVLDVGSGTGAVAEQVQKRGGRVIGYDISAAQLRIARQKGVKTITVGDAMILPFPDDHFEIVLSSDVIEHTANPVKAIEDMIRVLRPGGYLGITAPNIAWKWLVWLGNISRFRPYEGYENFLSFSRLRRAVSENGMDVISQVGLHPWPFQIHFLQSLSAHVDRHYGASFWGKWMINQAIFAQKPG